MSVQFGRWNFDGQPVARELLRNVGALTAKYGPDGESLCLQGSLALLFQPFHTTKDTWPESQPLANHAGVTLTWDGRLDNRDCLIPLLTRSAGTVHTDAEIALAAYEEWGTASFAKLVGDWALAVWDPTTQALLLAKDFTGSRQLFYMLETGRVTWSTVLEPLVSLAQHPLKISEEFIAGYLSIYPAKHLTPYVGISAVPASSFVQIERTRTFTQEYWNFDPSHCIRYRSNAEYEEHFRHAFAEAVRRRLRSSYPILAELSGGMDSTSIVCEADAVIAQGKAETPRLDTISYYDDDEPNWDERAYFSLVEKKRGREGYHINVAAAEGAFLPPDTSLFFPLPGQDRLIVSYTSTLNRCLRASESRILLSGVGGDEFLGGRPTPLPELQDLCVQFRWLQLMRQLHRFTVKQRRPWLHLAFDTVEQFLPQAVRRIYKHPPEASWLATDFVQRHAEVFWADNQRNKVIGERPSFQSNIRTLNHLRRQLNCSHLSPVANHRVTYPYFDRDLLTFLFAIPREQFVRPGERRALMRRALSGLVPSEIIDRKRKGFVARRPLVLIDSAFSRIEALLQAPLSVSYGWIDKHALSEALSGAKYGKIDQLVPLLGLLRLELWLRTLLDHKALSCTPESKRLPEYEGVHGKADVVAHAP